jgi:hypothetical protein
VKQHAVTAAPVVDIPIDRVVIGERRRQKLGRLKLLARSIDEHGLIHPILLRGETLVAGHRRLEACRLLNWKTIRARQVERLSDDQLRALELDENTERLDLDDYETSKRRLAQIRQVEADLKAKAKEQETRRESRQVSTKRGPSPTPGSRRQVEQETGIDRKTQHEIERHVALAETYPFLQRPEWRKPDVLKAGDLLEQLGDADRAAVVALLDQPAIPPEKALPCLMEAVDMTPEARAQVVDLATSADPFHHREALSLLADLPTPPDPALVALSNAVDKLRHAAKVCRHLDFKAGISVLRHQVTDFYNAFAAADKEARHGKAVR